MHRYDLTPAQIEADYWLIRTLFAWMQALDGSRGMHIAERPATTSAGRPAQIEASVSLPWLDQDVADASLGVTLAKL